MKFCLSAREKALAAGLVLIAASATSSGAIVGFNSPDMDLYMYANSFDRGGAEQVPIFAGPVGVGNGTDDRLSQMVIGWNTAAAGIPAGCGVDSYVITRVTVKATQVNNNTFKYDPTYDSFHTYNGAAGFVADSDEGKPIELYGVGLRNGFTGLAVNGAGPNLFGESSSFGTGEEKGRNAFAYSPSAPGNGDVSENVSEQFETKPFAIGMTSEVQPGQLVPADTEFTFQLNLADPLIVAYLRSALNKGELGLTLSSLHEGSFNGSSGSGGYPRFYTKEYGIEEIAPQLEIEYTLVPEPSAVQGLLVGAALLASARAWRRRDRFE
jgi:hypothetical protein